MQEIGNPSKFENFLPIGKYDSKVKIDTLEQYRVSLEIKSVKMSFLSVNTQ